MIEDHRAPDEGIPYEDILGQNSSRDNDLLDLGAAFVDRIDTDITIDALDGIFVTVAIATMEL